MHWADLDDFQGTSKGGEKEGGQLVKRCVFLNFNFKWEKPEYAAQGREAVERGNCKRVIAEATSWWREGWIQKSTF